jgi:micrococcal nuclease
MNTLRDFWNSGTFGKAFILIATALAGICCLSGLAIAATSFNAALAPPTPTLFLLPTAPNEQDEPAETPDEPTEQAETDQPTETPSASPTFTPSPTLTSTPTATFTAAPTSTPLPTDTPPQSQSGTVVRVIDGDTIEVSIGGAEYSVRYIGIDSPERGEACYEEATTANASLVAGRSITLERDVSETDIYDRLLRYVYVGDEFVNAELVRQGYAVAADYPPDTAYSSLFHQLEDEARAAGRGCWAPSEPEPTSAPPASSSTCSCGSNTYNCDDFATHAEAQACYQHCLDTAGYDVHRLDGDNDGSACEALP